MNTKRYAVAILAAGFSSRIGHFKPLLKIGGETITDRVIHLFLSHHVDVFLVVGWKKEKLCSGLKRQDIKVVENPDFQKGMFTSIQAGLRAVQAGGYQAVFVHPVDIPLVRPFTIHRLLEMAEEFPGRIIYPFCGQKRGHPPLIPIEMVPAVLNWQENGGLKAFLERQGHLPRETSVPDINIHFDIDTYPDYEALLERFQHYEIPSLDECEVILSDVSKVEPERRRHCYKVSEIACAMGQALLKAGEKADLELVRSASILHDIAKGQKDHAAAGGRFLHEMGFGKTGDIISAHSDLPDGIAGSSLEAKIVYLADKFVSGETLVTVEKRYAQALERFGTADDVKTLIRKRGEDALSVKKELSSILGYPLEHIIFA